MNVFFIFSHPNSLTVAMPVGFSRPAAVFGLFWSVFHGLWLPSAMAALVLVATVSGIHGFLAEDTEGLLLLEGVAFVAAWLAIGLVFGIYGNLWRKERLLSLGYALAASVEATTPSDAVAFFETGVLARPLWFRSATGECKKTFLRVAR